MVSVPLLGLTEELMKKPEEENRSGLEAHFSLGWGTCQSSAVLAVDSLSACIFSISPGNSPAASQAPTLCFLSKGAQKQQEAGLGLASTPVLKGGRGRERFVERPALFSAALSGRV